MATDPNPGRAYHVWLREVDKLCLALLGVKLADLRGLRTRDAFDNDVSPAEFLQELLLHLVREKFGSRVDKV